MSKAKIRLKRKYRKIPLKGWSYSSRYMRKIKYPKGLLVGGLWSYGAFVHNPKPIVRVTLD